MYVNVIKKKQQITINMDGINETVKVSFLKLSISPHNNATTKKKTTNYYLIVYNKSGRKKCIKLTISSFKANNANFI